MVPPLKAGCLFCPTQSVYSSDGVLEEALSLAVMNPPVRAQAAVVIALWPTHTHIYNSKTMFIFLLETLKGVPRKLFPCACEADGRCGHCSLTGRWPACPLCQLLALVSSITVSGPPYPDPRASAGVMLWERVSDWALRGYQRGIRGVLVCSGDRGSSKRHINLSR